MRWGSGSPVKRHCGSTVSMRPVPARFGILKHGLSERSSVASLQDLFVCGKKFSFVFRSRAARFPNADDSLGRPSSTRQALHVLLLSCRREGRLCVLVDLELKEAVPGAAAAAAAAVGWTGHGAWDLLTERKRERETKRTRGRQREWREGWQGL